MFTTLFKLLNKVVLGITFVCSGLLRGPPNAGLPRKLAFASSFDQGALLSVGWSNGLVTFHPFYFQES